MIIFCLHWASISITLFNSPSELVNNLPYSYQRSSAQFTGHYTLYCDKWKTFGGIGVIGGVFPQDCEKRKDSAFEIPCDR